MQTHADLQPPEWVAGVGTPIKETTGFGSSTQQVLGRQALGLRDVTDLKARAKTRLLALGLHDIFGFY